MVLNDGLLKGMKLVLEERGIDTSRMRAADMQLVLASHADFKNEKTALECLMQEKGQYSNVATRPKLNRLYTAQEANLHVATISILPLFYLAADEVGIGVR